MSCSGPSGQAGDSAAGSSIPAIAEIAGIQVGYSTMEELEARLGKGKPFAGGHPNGAREWRVRGTSWTIRADAFDYSSRGILVDSFDLRTENQPDPDTPYARLDNRLVGWLGLVSPGITEDQLLGVLKAKEFPAKKTITGWETSARGNSQLTSMPSKPFQNWTTSFAVKNGSVLSISLDVRN